MRAFFAFDPDPRAAAVLSGYLAQLQRAPWSRHIKWVANSHLHGTLRFLGEVDSAHTRRLLAQMDVRLPQIASGDPIELRFGEPRLFPTPSRPRVLACLIEPNERLSALANACEAAAVAIGLPPEARGFHGHITLGRMRERWPRDNRLDVAPAKHVMRIDALTLYESVLAPGGPTYTPRQRWTWVEKPL